MTEVNKEARKQRHQKLVKSIHSTTFGRIRYTFSRQLARLRRNSPGVEKPSQYRHPTESLPAPELFYRKVVACGVALLLLTSINLRGVAYASNPDFEAYQYTANLSISSEDVVALSDSDGFLLKSAPYGSSVCDVTRSGKVDYEVQAGDSLSSIASCYNLKVSSLLYANPALGEGDYLKVGQDLTIPEADGIYIQVDQEVSEAEDLKGVIEAHSGDYEATLAHYGYEDSSEIPEGTELIIINGGPPKTTQIASAGEVEVPSPSVAVPSDGDEPVNTDPVVISYPQGDPTPPVVEQPTVSGDPASGTTVEGPSYIPSAGVEGFIWPVANGIGVMTCGYLCYPGHYAIDIALDSMPDVVASKSGTVVTAMGGCAGYGTFGCNGGYGNYIVIDHGNGEQTLYAHNNVLYVSVGDYVYQGQPISQMGNTGNVWGGTGIHVHFEIMINGQKQNPFNYLIY